MGFNSSNKRRFPKLIPNDITPGQEVSIPEDEPFFTMLGPIERENAPRDRDKSNLDPIETGKVKLPPLRHRQNA